MARNRLRLNASKTEVILLGSERRSTNYSHEPLEVAGSIIPIAGTVRNLGVMLDPALSFRSQVTSLSSISYYYIRQLRSIRKSLTADSCHALVRVMILSRLDYCNGLLYGAPMSLVKQLDGVMRAAARLVLQLPRMSSVTMAMRDNLHWLDISSRIDFKLGVLAFRSLHGLAPPYLSRLCTPVSSVAGRSHLRSASSGELVVPTCKTKSFGPRAFAASCPTVWNSLPADLRDFNINSNLLTFRKKLKTFLFKRMLSVS